MPKLPKYLVNLTGEYRVCSELNRRGVFATVTYGNRKGADVYAISDQKSRALRIEVKTTQGTKFPNRVDPDNPGKTDCPDFWVLFALATDDLPDRFFVLSDKEFCDAQRMRTAKSRERYRAKHGRESTNRFRAVHLQDVEAFKDKWEKIVAAVGGAEMDTY